MSERKQGVIYQKNVDGSSNPKYVDLLEEDNTTTEDKMVQLDLVVDKLFRKTIVVSVANRRIYLRQFCKKIK